MFGSVIIVHTVHMAKDKVGPLDMVISMANTDLNVVTELFTVHDHCALLVVITDKKLADADALQRTVNFLGIVNESKAGAYFLVSVYVYAKGGEYLIITIADSMLQV